MFHTIASHGYTQYTSFGETFILGFRQIKIQNNILPLLPRLYLCDFYLNQQGQSCIKFFNSLFISQYGVKLLQFILQQTVGLSSHTHTHKKKTKPCCAGKFCMLGNCDWVSTPGKGHSNCVCVSMCDLSGQVTGIRVRREDDWLQGDETQTHTRAATQTPADRYQNTHWRGRTDTHAGMCGGINHTHLSEI